MQEVNYEKTRNLILKYYESRECYEEIITNQKDKEDFLFSILKDNSRGDEIEKLRVFNSLSYSTVFYNTVDKINNKETENILIYREVDDKKYPVFKMEHYKSNNKMVDSYKTTYIIYKENSNRVESRFQISAFNNGEYEDNTITILDTIRNNEKEEYMRKQYNLCLKYNKLLMIRVNNQMFIDGEDGFINRSEPIMRSIYQIFLKIENRLATILDTNIKIYEIKRK